MRLALHCLVRVMRVYAGADLLLSDNESPDVKDPLPFDDGQNFAVVVENEQSDGE